MLSVWLSHTLTQSVVLHSLSANASGLHEDGAAQHLENDFHDQSVEHRHSSAVADHAHDSFHVPVLPLQKREQVHVDRYYFLPPPPIAGVSRLDRPPILS